MGAAEQGTRTPTSAKGGCATSVAASTPTPTPSLPPDVERRHRIEGTDPSGKKAKFEVSVIAKNAAWERGSTTRLLDGDIKEKGKGIFSEDLQNEMRSALGLICVGTADIDRNEALEEERASSRSRMIANVAIQVRGSERNVYTLNLGKWICQDSKVALEDQRRLILIAITEREEGVELKSALRNALASLKGQEPITNEMLSCYSKSKDLDIR